MTMAPISDIQRQTYTELYRAYSGRLYGVCLHYVHDHDLANDLLHDSFIVIFSSLDQLRDSTKLEPWMRSIVRNIALKHIRRTQMMPESSIENIPEPAFEETSSHVSEIPLDDLLKVIDELPEQYGKVFRLSILDGLSHKEIGEIMGIAPHSSSSNLARAKQMLRKIISQNWGILLTFCLCIIAILFIAEDKNEVLLTDDSIGFNVIKTEKAQVLISDLISAKALKPLPSRAVTVPKETPDETDALQPEDEESTKEAVENTEAVIEITEDAITEKHDSEEHDTTYDHADIGANRQVKRRLSFGFSGGILNSGTEEGNRQYPEVDFAPPVSNPGYEESVPTHTDKTYRHHMPISFSVSVQLQLNDIWAVSTGLRYTYLHSEITESPGKRQYGQDIHYLGIPLKASWTFWRSAHMNAYASAGTTFELPLSGQMNGRPLDVPCQWSAGLGAGLQYNITHRIGIYIEPEFYWYFNNGSSIRTIRTERPLSINIPVGIRFSW